MAQNIHAGALMADRRRLITFPLVSEFVFGTHNAAFVQVMYEQYLRDPASVSDDWRQLFDNGRLAELPVIPTDRAEVLGRGEKGEVPSAAPTGPSPLSPLPGTLTPITGPAGRLVQNMTDSLSVPTATSFREITVDVLDARRRELNARLATTGKKISYTHLIGYAIVRGARDLPVMTHAFQDVDGKPHRFDPHGVNLGLAVDVEKRDGSRALVVPVIKHADGMDFATFHATYESLIEKARGNKLLPDDFAGATITLTNPGTIGTVASVPRLMKGQGSIIATGAIRQIGPAKVMTITSTYDHRVIQGAESGMFLRRLDGLLQGEENFYEAVFESLRLGTRSREQGAVRAAATAGPTPLPPARPRPAGAHVGDRGAAPRRRAAHLRPRQHPRRCVPAAPGDLLRHHLLRSGAHRQPPGARVAASGDRVGRASQTPHAGRQAQAVLAAHRRGDARALPAPRLPRPEAVLDRGARRARADARSDDRTGRRERRPSRGAGHGASRPAQRAGPHRGAALRDDLRRVRGRAARGGDADAGGGHGRREVPPRRRRRVSDRRRQAGQHHAVPQPEPPRGREPGGRRAGARQPDEPARQGVDPRRDGGGAGPDPPRPSNRRRGGAGQTGRTATSSPVGPCQTAGRRGPRRGGLTRGGWRSRSRTRPTPGKGGRGGEPAKSRSGSRGRSRRWPSPTPRWLRRSSRA